MANTASAPAVSAPATVAVTPKAAVYAEDAIITLLAPANPKRAASAKRFALYVSGMTVKAYLDGCALLHPEDPRYRWRADLAWDVKRGFISVAPASPAPAPATK